MNRRPAIILLLLLTATTASALTIVGHNSATNDRFISGYASFPVENSSVSFLGNGYDLSGVGWNPSNTTQSFAMISDQFFVYANHYAPGSTLNFYSPTLDTVVSYGVSATSYHYTFNSQTSDFAIGKLSAVLNPAHGITSYAILDLPTIQSYAGLPVLIYGHGSNGPRLGANVLDAYGSYNFPNGGTTPDSYGIGYSYNSSLSGDSMFQSGDSSSPTFVPWHGSLALLGTHSVTATIGVTPYSIDNFIPAYFGQMALDGIDFSVVPEPSRVMLLLLGACALLRRRHHASRE
ncbi:MAG: PEP-CTERM sorting domain-containing protein [Prosthecobacter sp.]|uniref:PEP-CTERM sorting domain-containing protein n=1 Tax=Prosthecobacter sp. TaxID=1965333 RepID=UPI0038FE6D6F